VIACATTRTSITNVHQLAITVKEISGACIPTIPAGTYCTIAHLCEHYSFCDGLPISQLWNDEFELVKDESKREFAKAAVRALARLNADHFARSYVQLRQAFFHKHNPDKLICSTAHGIDFFSNLLFVMDGGQWREGDLRDKRESEYSKNFKLLART
jgi:hypothetical protein